MARIPYSVARVLTGLTLGFGLSLGVAACDEDCEAQEQCRCTADHLCLEGLTCLSNYCVRVEGNGSAGSGSSASGGSGGGSSDNVAACEAWVDGFECGGFDAANFATCDALADFDCDVTAYYDCLDDNADCTDAGPDVVAWADCAELLTCE